MLPYNVMSPEDNSDAFEELESSSNKSSDLKDSVNENGSNLKEANVSATNRPTTEVNKPLVFKLDWLTRDSIIVSLNQYTQLLCGEKAEAELAEDKLMNDNTSLYQALLNLPLKSDVSTGSRPSRRVTLDLDSSAKLQIISTLVEDHSLMVHAESASEESKMKMVEQNNDLICKLAKLPFSITKQAADESVLDDNANQLAKRGPELAMLKEEIKGHKSYLVERATKHAEIKEAMTRLSQIIEDKQTGLNEQATKNSDLSKKVDELRKAAEAIRTSLFGKLVKLTESSTRRLDLGLNRKDVDFVYELNGVDDFLKSKTQRYSDYFFAGGLAWYLRLKPSIKDGCEYLSIRLYAEDYVGDVNWSIRVEFEISVLDQSGSQNRSFKSTQDFINEKQDWGWPEFIAIQKLKTGGYVKDDEFRVRAHLNVVSQLARTE